MRFFFVPSVPAVHVAVGRLERLRQLPLPGCGGSFKGRDNEHRHQIIKEQQCFGS